MLPPAGDLSGAVLDGRYKVIEPVAEGAMGVVYRAERVKLGRIVAIKVLHDELPNELSSRKRFEIEAMAMAKLEHPHCAAVLDVGVHEERPFVVMDFVSGVDLRAVITEGAQPIARAVEIVRQVLSGLAHAHELGIIHRDIKPANIILSQKAGLGDHVKILDFGLARLSAETSNLTTGIAVGTPSYMAPEQIRGLQIDTRADLYAVGVLLFELLTGQKPFTSPKDDPIEVCGLHLKAPPPRLADARPGVDFGELEDVVARALAKAPDERFASAEEMAAVLTAAGGRAGVPLPAAIGEASQPNPAFAPTSPSLAYAAQATGGAVPAPASGPMATPASGPVAMPASGPVAMPASSPVTAPAPGPHLPFAPTVPSGQTIAAGRPLPFTRTQLAIAGGAVLAVIVGVAIAASGGSSGRAVAGADAGVAAPEIAMQGDAAGDVVVRATALAEDGRREAAIDLVVGARRTYPDDARLAYLAGTLYFEKLWFSEGLKQYRDAVRLEPAYTSDPELIKTVLRAFNTTPHLDDGLARFLRETIGAPAKPYLEETAQGHPRAKIRARATAELRRY